MTYGHATRGPSPVLHVYARTVHHRGPTPASRYDYVIWLCGSGAREPVLSDDALPLPPCRACRDLVMFEEPYDVVYFGTDGDRIKIGQSRRPAARCAELGIALLAVLPGDGRTEHALHLAFAHRRIGGEWFETSPDLLAFINVAAEENIRQGVRTPVVEMYRADLADQVPA